jgi:hypothetical protein
MQLLSLHGYLAAQKGNPSKGGETEHSHQA